VDGADAAWMAGAPGFQKIKRFTAHLADGDAAGTQAGRRAHEVGERSDAVLGALEVPRLALRLARVVDENHTAGCLGEFRE